jgi:uncharacterized membrane protein YoaK (UPF0700 family)
MSRQAELDPADYHLRLMIDRMEREDRPETAIEQAVRVASGTKRQAAMAVAHNNHTAIGTRPKRVRDNGRLSHLMGTLNTTWQDVTATLRPRLESPDGPLPPLLLALTVVTGLVDATSYLKLGRVFVANMTGNVVFLGFGIAGAAGISILASLTAIASFLAGGLAGGRIGARWSTNRGRQLTFTATTELLLVTGALVVAALAGHQIGSASRYALIVLLAIAMGIQNATARKLAVLDLTTTVLTMTITGIAADAALAGGPGSKLGRRALSIAAMLFGASIGGLLALKVDPPAPLALAAGLLATVSFFAHRACRSTAAWNAA